MLKCFVILLVASLLYRGTEVHDSNMPLTFDGLSQVVYFKSDIISGAKPEGEEGFTSLKQLNVHTIICVDGPMPDVQSATSHGIRTIHIPLKYNSPNAEQMFDLTTVVSRAQLYGNVYIHCHHGKHRSATASAIVSIALGLLSVEEAKERMLVSETSLAYVGLWNAVENTKRIKSSDLLKNSKSYPSMVHPEGMIESMISLDEAIDNLQQIQLNGWQQPDQLPELVGAAEAGRIVDLYRKLQLSKETNEFSTDFETQIVNAIHQANGLEEALLQKLPATELNVFMSRVEQSCINCHSLFRK